MKEVETEMVVSLVFANFKGGVGKTTNAVMTAYEFAKLGYRTLVCDLDPQANATQLLQRTHGLQTNEVLIPTRTMMVALSKEDLASAIVKIRENLYLIPSEDDFREYPRFLELRIPLTSQNQKLVEQQRSAYFANELEKIQDKFDVIILDVPPTFSIYTDSAIRAADEVVIVLQTQQRSLDGAKYLFRYLQKSYDDNKDLHFKVLGVLPVILKNGVALDNQILDEANELFGKNVVFDTVIKYQERLKRYDRLGISDPEVTKSDHYDKVAHEVYKSLTQEIIDRLSNE